MYKLALRPFTILFALLASLAADANTAAQAAGVPGVTAGAIVVGQSAALSGPSSELGTEMRDGALAWFDHVNSKGGVEGRKIVLKTLDDAYDGARSAKNTTELLQGDGVFALFGYVGLAATNGALPIVERSDVPFFAPLTGAPLVHAQFQPNVFNIRASNVLEMEKIAENLEGMGVKKIAVLYQNDVPGKAVFDAFDRTMQKHKLTIMGNATAERNSVNVAAAVTKIRAMEPTVVVMFTSYPASAAFIRGMRKDATSIPFFWNISFVGSQGLAKALGADASGVMISQVMPSPWNDKLALIKEYNQLYLGKPGRQPGFSSLEGFIAAKAFVKGLEDAGAHLTRASFKKALESMHGIDLGGYALKFSPTNHEASSYVELTVLRRDGTFLY
jgi:ABC-type branched-subunit amino acid transport system substrate-binding protein